MPYGGERVVQSHSRLYRERSRQFKITIPPATATAGGGSIQLAIFIATNSPTRCIELDKLVVCSSFTSTGATSHIPPQSAIINVYQTATITASGNTLGVVNIDRRSATTARWATAWYNGTYSFNAATLLTGGHCAFGSPWICDDGWIVPGIAAKFGNVVIDVTNYSPYVQYISISARITEVSDDEITYQHLDPNL